MVVRERVEVLWEACDEGDAAKVKQLFEKGLTLREARENNNAALCYACEGGHVEVAHLLFEKGLTAEDARYRRNWALRWACAEGHVEVVCLLFEKGLTAEDARECYALCKACYKGRVEVVRVLFEVGGLTAEDARTNRNYALMMACTEGHDEVVRVLFDKGLTAEDALPCEALWGACYKGHVEVVRVLFEKGITAEDARECDALWVACMKGHVEVVRELVERGVRFERGEQLPGEERLHDAKTMWLVLEAGGGQCMPCAAMNHWYKKGGELGRMGKWRRSATSTEQFEARLLFKTIVRQQLDGMKREREGMLGCPAGNRRKRARIQ